MHHPSFHTRQLRDGEGESMGERKTVCCTFLSLSLKEMLRYVAAANGSSSTLWGFMGSQQKERQRRL